MTFDEFFQALYGTDEHGNPITAFPWQKRLAEEVIDQGWRSVLDLPTASGKTTAIDIAVFHLVNQLRAIREGRIEQRTAPLRIFFIVDRRIVVDGAFRHALHLAKKIHEATTGPLAEAAQLMRDHFQIDRPLQVSLMRGGMYRDSGWTASPAQPTVCVSTVDQVGSRLLFRGYGVSPSMRPVHAGLVANDSLLLIDEAHLSEPFLQTLDSVRLFSSDRFAERFIGRLFQTVQMSATTAGGASTNEAPFQIDENDRNHPVLGRRFSASKIARIEKVDVNKDDANLADEEFASTVVARAIALSSLRTDDDTDNQKPRKKAKKPAVGESFPQVKVVGIVVNRVRTARLIFDKLRKRAEFRDPLAESGKPFSEEASPLAETILLTGRMRPFDRDELLFRQPVAGKHGWLEWIKSGRTEHPPSLIFVVATQTVEVGADLDFDALVTEAAPLDCLRQRFGRLDRRGDRRRSQAFIVGRSVDVGKTAKDRVYGDRLTRTWQWLIKNGKGKGKDASIDFGVDAMERTLKPEEIADLCAERENAPILLPPYIDLWARTNPTPAADPDVGPFLHGPSTTPADVQVVWRADLLQSGESNLNFGKRKDYITTIALLPPNSMEACSLPIYEVKRWLSSMSDDTSHKKNSLMGDIADVEGDAEVEDAPRRCRSQGRLVVRWQGTEKSKLGDLNDIRPGDTIVVPASYGGHDRFGWQPLSGEVQDIAEGCSRWARARPSVRCHAGLLTMHQWGDSPNVSLPSDEDSVSTFLESILRLEYLPDAVRQSCKELIAKSSRSAWCIPYDAETIAPKEWVVVSKKRLPLETILDETKGELDVNADDEFAPTDEDQSSFTGSGQPVSLDEHTDGVVEHVKRFSISVGLDPSISNDLILSALWHDVGKIDERFQTLLHKGDFVLAASALAAGEPLAKSGQTFRNRAEGTRARRAAGVPNGFRHEELSVILLRESALSQVLDSASDRELVEYICGSHHGNGRATHHVVLDQPPTIETSWRSQMLKIDTEAQINNSLYRLDNGWEDLFVRMNRRYGHWGLAWLEAIFRLADHRQSALDGNKPAETEKALPV